MNFRVSVVIPTFNRKDVVSAVRSVLNQSHPPLEVIVVNDGGSASHLCELRGLDRRIRVVSIDTPSGDGGATARNRGVSESRGDWVAFLDDDDVWTPHKLRINMEQVVHARASKRMVFATAVIWAGDPAGSATWPLRKPGERERVGDYLFVRKREGEGWLPTSALTIARSTALAVPFAEGRKQHVDYEWLLDLEAEGIKPTVTLEIGTVMNVPPQRASVSTRATWRRSLEWADENRAQLGDRAYSSFCMSEVSRRARQGGDYRAFFLIAWTAFGGRPNLRQTAIFLVQWLLPIKLATAAKRARRIVEKRISDGS